MTKHTAPLALQFATNMNGRLSEEIIKRIEKFLKRPSFNAWDDIHGIIIGGEARTRTIWQALLQIDPTFPRRGRSEDMKGRVIKEWERIPTPQDVIEAINHVVMKSYLNNSN